MQGNSFRAQTTVCNLWPKTNRRGQPYYTARCGHLQIVVTPVKNPRPNEAPYALLLSETADTNPANAGGGVA